MYFSAVEALEKKFQVDPMYGYDLIKAAKKSGYRPQRHGNRFMCWFMDKVYATLNPQLVEKNKIESKMIDENTLPTRKTLKV